MTNILFSVMCPLLNLPNGNMRYGQPLFTVDSVACIDCFSGYRSTGSNSTTCLNSGNWSQLLPMCIQSIKLSQICWLKAFIYSNFYAIHTVGNVCIFILLKFEKRCEKSMIIQSTFHLDPTQIYFETN